MSGFGRFSLSLHDFKNNKKRRNNKKNYIEIYKQQERQRRIQEAFFQREPKFRRIFLEKIKKKITLIRKQ